MQPFCVEEKIIRFYNELHGYSPVSNTPIAPTDDNFHYAPRNITHARPRLLQIAAN